MKIKTVRLDDETRDVLLRSTIDGHNLTLPGQLPRPLYEKVARAITAAGGKWNRHAGCHVFPHPVRETLGISDDTVEVVNVQQTYQAFYTPQPVANLVALHASVEPDHSVLEPSVGDGALVRALPKGITLTMVDINPKSADAMATYGDVITGDFLDRQFYPFDRIVMNPPFTGGQDVRHIRHALTMLKPGGRLVAICAAGPRQREEFKDAAEWIDLPDGSFKESGTNVSTAILIYNG